MKCCESYEILDERTGDIVCTNCARVEQTLIKFNPLSSFIENEFLQNICANNHIVKRIEEEAAYLFNQKKPVKKTKQQAYASYCLYLACKKEGVGRSLIEIGNMCDVSVSDIAAFISIDEIELTPSQLCSRVCHRLDISNFKTITEIEKLSTLLYTELLRCHPPQSALALAIFTLIKGKSLTNIAHMCDISVSSLRRLSKVYKTELHEIMSTHLHR